MRIKLLLFLLLISCDLESKKELPKKTKEELHAEKLIHNESKLKLFDGERIQLLSIKNGISYSKALLVIRDYKSTKVNTYGIYDDVKINYTKNLLDSIAKVHSLTTEQVFELVYSYKYNKCECECY